MTSSRCAESGPEDEVQGLGFAQTRRFFRRQHSQFDRFAANLLRIDAPPIVANLDHHLIALVIGIQPDLSSRRLALAPALLGRFDAVADRVPHHMRQGLGDGVENALIEVGFLPTEFQIHFAAALPRHIADDAREAPKQLVHRHHANLHHRALQIVQHSGLKGHGIGELAAQRFLGIALAKLAERLLQHRLANDELAHQVEHVVDPPRLDAQYVFHQSLRQARFRCRGLRLGGSRLGWGWGCWGWGCRSWGSRSPSIQRRGRRSCILGHWPGGLLGNSCGGSGRRCGLNQSHVNLARNRRNATLGGDLFLRLQAGKDELYLPGGGWRFRVRPHHQYLADLADRVLNHLPRGDRHGAVGIDFHHDLVQPQAGSLRLSQSALFRIRPVFVGSPGAFYGFFLAWRFLGRRIRGQLVDFLPQAFRGGHRASALVGREHLRKDVGGGKSDFCQRPMGGRALQRKRIFEMVRQFAQLAQPASRRVALQGMHRPADRTHDLFIAGMILQLQRFLVQRLQQFLRGLKKQLPQFRSALIGRIRHWRTSIRW